MKKKLYIMVEVQSGIPVSIETFKTIKEAQRREKTIRSEINLESDETGIFEISV